MHHKKPFKKLLLALLFWMTIFTLSLFLLLLPLTSTSTILQQACGATRFPSSCLAALSSSPPPTSAAALISASLSAAAAALPTANSISQSILSSSTNPNTSTVARNCIEHLSLAARRLSDAAASSTSPPNSRAFAGAALLYQYDCWSALKYVNTTIQIANAMSFVDSLYILTSNALAMISAFQRFGDDFSLWIPPQTERDGYWGQSHADDSAAPEIVGGVDLPAPDVRVCVYGECEFRSVQEAVRNAPNYGSRRFVIYIKEGVYEEIVNVPIEKTNVGFVGDGMGKTIITGNLNAQMIGISTYNTATVSVFGDGFFARNLTIKNTAGAKAHQAVAFRSDSDRSVVESVEFWGHQDTLYARSLRQIYRYCRILGTVDFIFGNSAAIFERCEIVVVPRAESAEKGESNAVAAHGRTDPGQATGFVFRDCVVNGSDEYVSVYRRKPKAHRVYLGRPWKEFSRTVFLNCYLEEMVVPQGWLPWSGDFALATLFYGEYESRGPGANSTARVSWSSQIMAEHLGIYSAENFLQGNGWVPGD